MPEHTTQSVSTYVLSTDDAMLDEVPLERLETEISSQAGRLAAATAVWLVWIGAYDRRQGWAAWQAKSCAHWLSWRCGVAPRTAREHVRTARSLEELPLVRERFLAGELSYSKVRAITRVATPLNEADMVDIAIESTGSQVERICGRMKPKDRNELSETQIFEMSRSVNLKHNDDGTSSLVITLPRVEAKTAYGAIQRKSDQVITRQRAEGETNTDVIERLGGLGAIQSSTAVGLLDGSIDAPEGSNLDMLLVVDHEALADPHADGDCHLDSERISPVIARRISCDTKLQIAVRDAVNDALGVGSSETRIVNRATRRLLSRRDHGMCQFPGCEATRRLHAHHIIHWANGGLTELDNLILLCHHHHHSVHEGGWNIRRTEAGRHEFIDPNGHIQRVPKLHTATPGQPLPIHKNGSAEPLSASGERANTDYIADIILTNTSLRKLRQSAQ